MVNKFIITLIVLIAARSHGAIEDNLYLALEGNTIYIDRLAKYFESESSLPIEDGEIVYKINIIEPDPNIDYKIILIKPDADVDYTLRILDPRTRKDVVEADAHYVKPLTKIVNIISNELHNKIHITNKDMSRAAATLSTC